MRNFTITKLMTAMSFLALGAFMSCGSDDPDPIAEPVAAFTIATDGKTITITNTSTDAVTYAWEFGDSEVSTEEAPTHTYAANGTYVVKLTVVNESGSDNAQAVSEIINITIDGAFDDWTDVASVGTPDPASSIKEVKVENLGNSKLYFYVRTSSASFSFIDLFINLDYGKLATDTTGYVTFAYGKSNFGYDVLLEGFIANKTAVATHGFTYATFYLEDEDGIFSTNTPWAPVIETFNSNFTSEDITSVGTDGDQAYEFMVDLSTFPSSVSPEEGAEIQFFMADLNNDPDDTSAWWGGLGSFPIGRDVADDTETPDVDERAEAVTYKLK